MEDERNSEACRERDQADDEPSPQLVEMLDERSLLTVAKTPREPHLRLGSCRLVAARAGGNRSLFLRRRELDRLVVLAGDRVFELTHPLPQRTTHLGQPLWAEDEQHDEEQDEDLPDADTEGHV
jgi:hypothetical protein